MRLSEFDFPFDASLIAEHPVEPRDEARLLVVERSTDRLIHRKVRDLPGFLRPGDLLIVNDTKVMQVRLMGRKHPGGKETELLFVRDLGNERWEVMLKGRVRPGLRIDLGPQAYAVVEERGPFQTIVRVSSAVSVKELLAEVGRVPLPPYLKRPPTEDDRRWYQTIYAKREGAIAAPTAGLHFTEELLGELAARDIGVASITLHVGVGTFKPVTESLIENHRMLAERITVSDEVRAAILKAKSTGGRVIAIGTTVVRALESAALDSGDVQPVETETNLFIRPGYRFKVVDGLMTNFHLPRTTLIILVSAFLGRDRLFEAYQLAVRERYRFYSYGDAMLIL